MAFKIIGATITVTGSGSFTYVITSPSLNYFIVDITATPSNQDSAFFPTLYAVCAAGGNDSATITT